MTDISSALTRLRALSEKATPGPWQAKKEAFDDDTFERQYIFHAPDEHSELPCAFPLGGTKEDDNAALIVAAVNALPRLLACVEALEKMGDALDELSGHGIYVTSAKLAKAYADTSNALASLKGGA